MKLELFSCAGGMAEGFRRAGVEFDFAFDVAPDHCDSYEKNLGHRPVCMDVRDLLRMVRGGWLAGGGVELVVADPPCTPWSRAGKRQGTDDERDMLRETVALLDLLRPTAWLIGNVPGLDDADNWRKVVQPVVGGFAQRAGYCVDFARLDAADYGVPQHRIRPFWFGHRLGTACARWPAPTHGAPTDAPTLPGVPALLPWVTCRDALGHLPPDQLGRPVKLRKRACNTEQHGSVLERPARGVGTSNLSDGNVLLVNDRHAPAPTVGAKVRRQSSEVLVVHPRHPVSKADEPANTVCGGDGGGSRRAVEGLNRQLRRHELPQAERVYPVDRPAPTVMARVDRIGGATLYEWPWDRPATSVFDDDRIGLPGHHGTMFDAGAILLSERAAAILQGFPEGWHFAGKTKKARWSQLGQAMPPALAEAVARAVVAQMAGAKGRAA